MKFWLRILFFTCLACLVTESAIPQRQGEADSLKILLDDLSGEDRIDILLSLSDIFYRKKRSKYVLH